MEVYIGIPCYQVAELIEGVLSRICQSNPDVNVILVDDGSTDDLQEVIRNFNTGQFLSFESILHKKNRGYGAAQRSLFKAFQAKAINESDILVIVHGDGQTDESEIGKFVDEFKETGVDAVLGSRMLLSYREQRINGRPAFKIVFDHIIRIFLNSIFSLQYNTYASGFRAYTRKCLDMVDLSNAQDHHAFDTEMLLILGKHRISYSEIPVRVVNTGYKQEAKGKWLQFGIETIKLVWKHYN